LGILAGVLINKVHDFAAAKIYSCQFITADFPEQIVLEFCNLQYSRSAVGSLQSDHSMRSQITSHITSPQQYSFDTKRIRVDNIFQFSVLQGGSNLLFVSNLQS
jgi:hypothetical protein